MKTPSKNRNANRGKRRQIHSKTLSKTRTRRKRRNREVFRFKDVKGKTVEFVEMDTGDDRCVEIGFADKTALLFILDTDTRLTMQPVYSDWKTGNARVLRRWGTYESSG